MSSSVRKRFWSEVSLEPRPEGFAVLLDARSVRTPAKAELIVPTRPLGEAVLAEWAAQEDQVRPDRMPFTRAANAALDKVAPAHQAVTEMLAEYAASDLLCYRADSPAALVSRQSAGWDPWLDWSETALGAPLERAVGVMHIAQPEASLGRLHDLVRHHDPFRLTALHDLVTLSGSLVLGLAVSREVLDPAQGWDLSRIDEVWQEEQWGQDAEASALAATRRDAFMTAAQMMKLLKDDDE